MSRSCLTTLVIGGVVAIALVIAALSLGLSVGGSMSPTDDEPTPRGAAPPDDITTNAENAADGGSGGGGAPGSTPSDEITANAENAADGDGGTTWSTPIENDGEPAPPLDYNTPVSQAAPHNNLAKKFQLPDLGGLLGGKPPKVEHGVGSFVDPGPMEVDHWYPLEFTLGPDLESIIAESEGAKLTGPKPVFISKLMRVTLVPDPNFEARPAEKSGILDTGLDKTATWQWNIRPINDGTHVLAAKVEVLAKLDNGSLESIDTYTRRVSIRVRIGTWRGFLRALSQASSLGDALGTLFASWEKTLTALAALITASGGVWLAIRGWGKRKRKEKQEEGADGGDA